MTKKDKEKENEKQNGIITVILLLGLLGGALIGYAVYPWFNPSTDTRVRITIDSNFGVIEGGVLNKTCNCSKMELEAYSFSWNVYDAITAFFADPSNLTKMLGMNNITTETGVDNYVMGDAYYYMGNGSTMFSWPNSTVKMEGMSNTFSIGHAAAEPVIMVGSFINGTYENDDFMPNSTLVMDDALYNGNLTASVWNAAWMLKGFSSITIVSWNYDEYTLNVIVDGVATTWEEY